MRRPQIELPLPGGAMRAPSPGPRATGRSVTSHTDPLALGPGPSARGTQRAYSPLWLCIHLPDAQVEQLGPSDAPRAVVEMSAGRPCVIACDAAARRAGVRLGQSVHAARALLPTLDVVTRSIGRERAALERLAAWAMQYGPVVSPEPPQELYLEVRGSLKLCGGIERLQQRILADLAALGHRARIGTAPTASAARVLARAGISAAVEDVERLPGVLGALPLAAMDWDDALLARARGFGARQLRDLIRLPRDGLARRLGRRVLDDLDRALGKRPDPRQSYTPPTRYRGRLDLVHEQDDLGRIHEGLRRLLAELTGSLLARQCGVQRLRMVLLHRDHPDSRLDLELAAPSRDPEHLASLFAERMASLKLPGPVAELLLISGPLLALDPGAAPLFHRSVLPAMETDGAVPALIERLCARLGRGAVRGLALISEHRPEAAWRYEEVGKWGSDSDSSGKWGSDSDSGKRGPRGVLIEESESDPHFLHFRPLWLLAAPELLGVRDGRPCRGGPLRMISGPERIESGWWDGGDVRRDYYLMRDREGARLWVFRERGKGRRWFLHGLFA